jgi:hypothetical protein
METNEMRASNTEPGDGIWVWLDCARRSGGFAASSVSDLAYLTYRAMIATRIHSGT